ncbi:MAG: TonB-dependent receptor [Xanthomonadales bacterium]|nr:TonB-dependent receptor [Xanthomonadales bacterium]
MMPTVRALPLAIALALAALPAPLPAQESAGETAEDEAARLDTVQVTARRREETLQEVPVAVSAFDAEQLRELQASDLSGLQGAVPNVNIVQGRASASSVNVFIRGVGQPDALQTFDPAVGVYVDDVYLSRIQGALLSLFDVERVEVLRGPQGTLYGRNTAGGALKLITRSPFGEPRLDAEIVAGDFGRAEGRFYGAGAAGESAAFSLAGLYAENDGFVRDPATGRRFNDNGARALRAKLAVRPSDRLSITLSGDYTRQRNELSLGRAEAPLTQLDLVRGPRVLVPAPTGRYAYRSRTELPPDRGQDLDHSGLAAVLEWEFADGFTLKSISAWRELETEFWIDFDATERQVTSALVALDQRQFSEELQLLFDNREGLKGVLGLYHLDEKVPSRQEALANDFLALNGAPVPFRRTIERSPAQRELGGLRQPELGLRPRVVGLGRAALHRGPQALFPHHQHLLDAAAAGRDLRLRGRGQLPRADPEPRPPAAPRRPAHALPLGQPRLQVRRLQRPRQLRRRGQRLQARVRLDLRARAQGQLRGRAPARQRRPVPLRLQGLPGARRRGPQSRRAGADLCLPGAERGQAADPRHRVRGRLADRGEHPPERQPRPPGRPLPRVPRRPLPERRPLRRQGALQPRVERAARALAQLRPRRRRGRSPLGGDAVYRDKTWLSVDNREVLTQAPFTLRGPLRHLRERRPLAAGPARGAQRHRRGLQGRCPGVLERRQHPDRLLRLAAPLLPEPALQLLLISPGDRKSGPAPGPVAGRLFSGGGPGAATGVR